MRFRQNKNSCYRNKWDSPEAGERERIERGPRDRGRERERWRREGERDRSPLGKMKNTVVRKLSCVFVGKFPVLCFAFSFFWIFHLCPDETPSKFLKTDNFEFWTKFCLKFKVSSNCFCQRRNTKTRATKTLLSKTISYITRAWFFFCIFLSHL